MSPGVVTPAVDFDLDTGGTIAGTVSSAFWKAFEAHVVLLLDTGDPFATVGASTSTGASGAFRLARLPAGAYYLWADGGPGGFWGGALPGLYSLSNSVNCPPSAVTIPTTGPGCSLAQATPVAVTDRLAGHADISLDLASSLLGRVFGDGTHGAFTVEVTRVGDLVPYARTVTSPVTGTYALRNLPDGQYTVTASAPSYGSVTGPIVTLRSACPCLYGDLDLQAGVPGIPDAQPADRVAIAGQSVTLSVSPIGAGALSYQWYAGRSGDTSQPMAGGTARDLAIVAGTGPASYWVRVSNALGSADSRTAVVSPAAEATGAISGTVRSAGHPVANAIVTILSSEETVVASAPPSSADGAFAVAGLPPGVYYAYAGAAPVSGRPDAPPLGATSDYPYADVLYPDIACPGGPVDVGTYCRTNTGGAIAVGAGIETAGVDFDLPMGGSIGGRLSVANDQWDPTVGAVDLIVDGTGPSRAVATAFVGATGVIVFGRVPPGQYRVAARAPFNGPMVWKDQPCPPEGCLQAGGTPIVMTPGAHVSGVFFNLQLAPTTAAIWPAQQLLPVGQSASLGVEVSSASWSSAMQWYSGKSGDTTSPIVGARGATLTLPPFTAPGVYEYWVRVSTPSGTGDSPTATVTVHGVLVGGSGGSVTSGGGVATPTTPPTTPSGAPAARPAQPRPPSPPAGAPSARRRRASGVS
ncbi:MAG: carboxypeptidase-like regulatory domain-containing protein [Vicinamibacterales bacterium]